jgi:uncharacterized protein (DUF2249 family)
MVEVIDVRNLSRDERFLLIFEKLNEHGKLDVIAESRPGAIINLLQKRGYIVKLKEEDDRIKLEIRKPEVIPGSCPGASTIFRPKLEIKSCPHCGAEVERWTDEIKVVCENCGKEVVFEIDSCVRWCEYADKCLGERYREVMETLEELEARKKPLNFSRFLIKNRI